MKIPITKDNLIYAFGELDFTHDHSTVKKGSLMIDRKGKSHLVTKIDLEHGEKRFWSGKNILTHQYTSPHNMLTKEPFYAHEFKITKPS